MALCNYRTLITCDSFSNIHCHHFEFFAHKAMVYHAQIFHTDREGQQTKGDDTQPSCPFHQGGSIGGVLDDHLTGGIGNDRKEADNVRIEAEGYHAADDHREGEHSPQRSLTQGALEQDDGRNERAEDHLTEPEVEG